MRIEMKAAIVGAAGAVVAAVIALTPNLLELLGSEEAPIESAKLTLSVSRDTSPFQMYRLPEPPPAFVSHLDDRPVLGVYLWPEADLSEILPLLQLGATFSPPEYPTRDDFIDATAPDARRRSLEAIWQVIEAAGSTLRVAQASLPPSLMKADGQPLFSATDPNGRVGLAVLRSVYMGGDTRISASSNPHVRTTILFADDVFDGAAMPSTADAYRRYLAARFLATRRVFPVLDLTITNTGSAPVVATGIAVTVREVAPSFSALDSGPLRPADVVTFKLSVDSDRQVGQLASPLKVAPGDAQVVRVELLSDELFGYLCDFEVSSGDSTVAAARSMIVSFGFQPLPSAEPL